MDKTWNINERGEWLLVFSNRWLIEKTESETVLGISSLQDNFEKPVRYPREEIKYVFAYVSKSRGQCRDND